MACGSENQQYVVTYSAEIYSGRDKSTFIMYKDSSGYQYETITGSTWRKEVVFSRKGSQASLLVMPQDVPSTGFYDLHDYLSPSYKDNVTVEGKIICNDKVVCESSDNLVTISLFLY